jgi:hypothetical protein
MPQIYLFSLEFCRSTDSPCSTPHQGREKPASPKYLLAPLWVDWSSHTGKHIVVFCLCSFAFSRVYYKWNHTVCRLWPFSFTVSSLSSIVSWHLLFLFIPEHNCILWTYPVSIHYPPEICLFPVWDACK